MVFALALAWSIFLALTARTLFRLGEELPHEKNAADARITKWMGIVSGIQGVAILGSIVVLALIGQWVWIMPVVALIVGLHFLPMPAIFGRRIGYFLGAAMLVVAIIGMVLTVQQLPWQQVWALTGFDAAAVTSAYGLYMVLTALSVRRAYAAL